MPTFRMRTDTSDAPESPEALFRDLRPKDRQVRDLYLRQGDVLRAYHELDPQPSDVALELPTGAGKTLVGLLIAEFRRRALGHRVAFLCPNVQLARQAAAKADGYGINAVALVRQQRLWEPSEFQQFQRGRAIAVSTYNAVFNSSPRLPLPPRRPAPRSHLPGGELNTPQPCSPPKAPVGGSRSNGVRTAATGTLPVCGAPRLAR